MSKRFNTLKSLAEYAIKTESSVVEQHNTIECYIEQGWVAMSDKVREGLLKDPALMAQYIMKLLDKYRISNNVIDMFSWVGGDKSIFNQTIENNLKNKKKLSDERSKANRSVLRSYRIKR